MDIEGRLQEAQYRSQITMKRFPRLLLPITLLCVLQAGSRLAALGQDNAQQLAFAGLRAVAGHGQFNAVRSDSAGHLYLLLDQKDGIRVLKTDANATQVLSEAHFGAQGDIGLALALDPAGNVYITGTTTSGSLPSTLGAPFPAPADSSTNSFVAKLDSSLTPVFVTYAGSGRMAASAIAATADRVFITGGIYASTLPVTPSAIIQAPASGSTGNGFVECFNASGTSLLYATYLSGLDGDTNPSVIAVDNGGNAYIAGYTTSPGYPTIAAVVPEIMGSGSGFLTKLSPAGDAIPFSTFIPGLGISSVVVDSNPQTLLFSGDIAPGQFPITSAPVPLVSAQYQSVVRMSLDGSRVLTSLLLAPGTQSVVMPAPNGAAWAAVGLTSPLLPLQAISNVGTSAAFRITADNAVDKSVRFGGPSTEFSSMPVNITSIAVDSAEQPIFAGSANPTTSSSLLATETFDLPLLAPTQALPSTLRDAVLAPGSNCGSLCAGSGAYLAKLNLSGAPTLALSTDASPNIILRNLGSVPATALQITAFGFTAAHNCPSQLEAGAECDILVAGGPGSLTVQAANATAQTVSLSAISRTPTPLVYSPPELDFGILTATSPSVSRAVTVTNLGSAPVTSIPVSFSANPTYEINLSGDCPGSLSSSPLQPGATCHLVVNAAVPSSATAEGAFQSSWSSGSASIMLTGYTQLNSLHLSSDEIDFGTQFIGGLRLPRYLYLSNNSAASIWHSAVALLPSSPFAVIDRCPTLLQPHTICQLQIDYNSSRTSFDSITISLDQGNSVLITGKTIPQSGTGGTTTNPNLVVTPASLNFPNAVVVTGTSADTQTATISNIGTQPFPLGLSLTGDFIESTNCTSSLAAGASCSVVFTLLRRSRARGQGLLSVASGAGSTPAYVTLSGTATPILATNNGTLDLGTSSVGQPVVQWYKIAQPFTQFTAKTQGVFGVVLVEDIGYGHGQPASSAFTPTAVGSCINCWLGIQFLPAASGPQSSSLALTSTSSGAAYTLSLEGSGLPLTGLLLTPLQQDFGPIAVHSSSATQLFTLTNLTGSTATFSAPVVTGDYALNNSASGGAACIGPIAPNASCFAQVAFNPTATGPSSGTLTLASDIGTANAALTGFGSPDPGLSLKPAALIFRNVPDPSAEQQTILVTNTGLYDLQIGSLSTTSSSFQLTTSCGTLIPSATCTITVRFLPSTAMASGTLSIPVTSSAAGSPQTTYTVPLSGTYTTEDAALQILPGQADYGPTATSSLGLTRQFLLNNLTTQPIALTLTLPRQFVLVDPPCATVEPGSGCSFSVSFLPLTNGDVTGTLFAQGPASSGRPTINSLGYVKGFGRGQGTLNITGDLSPGHLIQFGQVPSGQTSIRSLTLTNSGSTMLTVRRITSEWPFLSSTTCGTTLSAGGSCAVTLIYSPLNQVPAGSSPAPFNTDTGTVVIESDAVSSPDFIDLTGTVTPAVVAVPSSAAPLYSYTLSQGSLSFTSTRGGEASAPQTLTLSNTGSTTLHVRNLISTSDFSVTGACPTLIPGTSCPLTIAFTPQASSAQTTTPVIGALEILSDSSTSLDFVSLLGTATPSTLALSPASLDFGSVLVGTPATLPIRITNHSSVSAVFRSIIVTGDYTLAGDCPSSGAQLAPSASCTLQVSFKPAQMGTRTGSVSIATSITTLPLVADLTGTGTQSRLQATPTRVSFGDVLLGASKSLTLTLANNGTETVSGISLAASGDYTIAKPCTSPVMASGGNCIVTLSFAPKALGGRSGSLHVTSSDPGSPMSISLAGNGTATPTFTLSVDGGTASTAKVKSGQPASYHLALTPQNGFTGPVVLNCSPVQAGQYATCSLLPSSVTLSGSTLQASVVTLNTVTETATSKIREGVALPLLLLPFGMCLFRRNRQVFVLALIATTTLFASGCGSGGTVIINKADPNLRYTPPGTYQYRVTATSATGTPLSQTVTLNLTVTAQ